MSKESKAQYKYPPVDSQRPPSEPVRLPGRPPDDPEGYSRRLTTLVSPAMFHTIEKRRGSTPRSAYLRQIIQTVLNWQDEQQH